VFPRVGKKCALLCGCCGWVAASPTLKVGEDVAMRQILNLELAGVSSIACEPYVPSYLNIFTNADNACGLLEQSACNFIFLSAV
jgi:hypothetical protein